MRLSPNEPLLRFRAFLGFALFAAGRYAESIEVMKALPGYGTPPTAGQRVLRDLMTAAAFVALGETDTAQAFVRRILDRFPETSIATLHPIAARFFHKKEDQERLLALYRKAGLPD